MRIQPLLFLMFTFSMAKSQFGPAVRMTNSNADSYTSSNNASNIAANGNTVHLVFTDEKGAGGEVYYRRSLDGGNNWGNEIQLTDDDGHYSGYPTIAVWNNEVHVAWSDSRDGNAEIYYKKSTNGGNTWSDDSRISTHAGASNFPSISTSGPTVHLIWQDERFSENELFYRRSINSGLSWSTEARLTNDPADSENASIASIDQTVHVTWSDRTFGNNEIFYKRSTDGGVTWGPDTRLTNDVSDSVFPSMVAMGTVVIVAWNDDREGNIEVYSRRSVDNGKTWEPETIMTVTPSHSYRPRLAANGPYAFLVWQEAYENQNWELLSRFSSDAGKSWAPLQRLTNAAAFSGNASACISGSRIHVTWLDERIGNKEIYYSRNPTGNPLNNDNFLAWSYQAGSTNGSRAYALATDLSGSILMAGNFDNTVDFDPGPGTINLTSAGVGDAFVSKTDYDGNVIWAGRFGGPESDVAMGLAVDLNQNVILCGSFEGTADFNPGEATFYMTSGTEADAYITKLDASGNFMWARKFGGSGFNAATAVKTDIAGNIYVTGSFHETADFDPGPATFNLTAQGEEDIFIAKLAPDGGLMWANRIGGNRSEVGRDLALDALGNIIITGYFTDQVDFDPKDGTTMLTSLGLADIFILSLNENGEYISATNIGGTGQDEGTSVALDAQGNIHVTGHFDGTVDFNPSFLTFNLVSKGNVDIFVLKLTADGSFAWANSFGGSHADEGRKITVDQSGNVLTTGFFKSTADFYSGPPISQLHATGNEDVFVSKLSAFGDIIWLNQLSGPGEESGEAILTIGNGAVYVAGYFYNTIDVDPTIAFHNHVSAGEEDLFLTRINTCASTTELITTTACDSYVSPDGSTTWTSSGVYTSTLLNKAGCDSIIIVDLTITSSYVTLVVATECEIYTSPGGNSWTESGVYHENYTSTEGCDSSITYQVTILHSSIEVMDITTCDRYTDPDGNDLTESGTFHYTFVNAQGCDSLLTLNLIVNHNTNSTIEMTGCDSLVAPIGNAVWYESGMYLEVIPNAAGCDSTITFDVTIRHVDTTIIVSASTITAQEEDASYQWLDCMNGYATIPGATGQSFTPDITGFYAAAITFGACTDTSSCYPVIIVSNNDPGRNPIVKVFPNPTDGEVTVDLGSDLTQIEIRIMDIHGRVLYAQKEAGTQRITLRLPEEAGLYYLSIGTNKGITLERIVKL